MAELIDREALNEELLAIKTSKGKLYQNDYRAAIDAAPVVEQKAVTFDLNTSNNWVPVTKVLPMNDCVTYVKVTRPGSDRVEVMAAQYKVAGIYNGGQNKWSCEPVVGVNAGCKVIEWYMLPEYPLPERME